MVYSETARGESGFITPHSVGAVVHGDNQFKIGAEDDHQHRQAPPQRGGDDAGVHYHLEFTGADAAFILQIEGQNIDAAETRFMAEQHPQNR